MEDGQDDIPTLGTLQKEVSRCPQITETRSLEYWLLCIIEWVLVDFQTLFRRQRKRTFARSPAFQTLGATWSLELSIDMCGPDEEGFFVDLRRHQSEATSHSIRCHIAVTGDQIILGGYVKEMCVKDNQRITGLIAESSKFLSSISNGRVRVLCMFYDIAAGQRYEEISKGVVNREMHSRKNTEGIDILSSHMKNLFLNRENCDFAIRVKGREFQVHKAILSARSSVLAAMLQHDMAEKNSSTTEIVDCEPDIFEMFLLYLYSGQVEELSWENATSLYTLGDKYDLEHLRKECVEFMESNLCVDAFCDVIILGVRHNLSTLVKKAEEFFLKNVTEILLTPKWQLLMKEHPITCNELFIKYSNCSKLNNK